MKRALVLSLCLAGPAAAQPEASLPELQAAAERLAGVEPSRGVAWLRRVRAAAALPTLRLRVGRGLGAVLAERGADGVERYSTSSTDSWRFDVEAAWSLDRLVYDPQEVRVAHEAQRWSRRRQELLTEVTRLYHLRRRLLDPTCAASIAPDPVQRAAQLEETSALLSVLTGDSNLEPQ